MKGYLFKSLLRLSLAVDVHRIISIAVTIFVYISFTSNKRIVHRLGLGNLVISFVFPPAVDVVS